VTTCIEDIEEKLYIVDVEKLGIKEIVKAIL